MAKAVRTESGKWHTVAYYKDSAGKVHRPSFTADTKAEVLFLAKQFENKQKEKAQKPNAQMTVGQAAKQFVIGDDDQLVTVNGSGGVGQHTVKRGAVFPDIGQHLRPAVAGDRR